MKSLGCVNHGQIDAMIWALASRSPKHAKNNTMRYINPILFFLVLMATAWGQDQPKTKIGPRLECTSKGWNFGVVNQGVSDKRTIVIKNVGDETLKIGDIKVTCGCVHALMSQKEIPPGESRELVLTLSTYRAYGLVRKHCYVYSNDPTRKRPLVLTIDGEVKADWWPDAKQVQFGRVEAGTEYKKVFRVHSRSKRALDIKSMSCRNPNLDISYVLETNSTDRKPTYVVTLTLKATQAPGPFAAAVAVRVDHRQTPLQNVMVYARVAGAAKLKPLKVFMGRIFYNNQAHKVVKLTLPEGYTITGAKPSTKSMITEIREMPDGVSWEVDLYVTGLESEKSMDESIEISTNDPMQPKILVPVNWVSRPKKQ